MVESFSTTTNVELAAAKAAAILQHPDFEDGIKRASTKYELYDYLSDNELVVYVEVDLEAQYADMAANEAETAKAVETELDEYCPPELDPVIFQQSDVESCEPEQPAPIPQVDQAELDELIAELNEAAYQSDGGLSDGKGLNELDPDTPIGKAMSCISKMESISSDMNVSLERLTKVKTTMINFEQLLYHYRVMELYYKSKLDTLDAVVDEFGVYIRDKRTTEDLILQLNDSLTTKQEELDEYMSNVVPGSTPTPAETALRDEIANIELDIQVATDKVVEIELTIQSAKDGTWSFDMEELQSGDVSTRRDALTSELESLVSSVTFDSGSFSNKVSVQAFEGAFRLLIQHTTLDEAGVLAGRDLYFTGSGGSVTILPDPPLPVLPTGILFQSLYNVWGFPDVFFTREERGLTANGSQMDPALADTGISGTTAKDQNGADIGENFISDMTRYESFYTNFKTNHDNKVKEVKETVIEPFLSAMQAKAAEIGRREALLLLSFGRVFEVLPTDTDLLGQGALLLGVIDNVRSSAGDYVNRLKSCRETYEYLVELHAEIEKDIDGKQAEFRKVPCADAPDGGSAKKESGGDPLGINMGKEDPNDPNITKMCYWVKFATFATAVNVLPLPGPGGLKYWPIGFTVPGPNGLIKIPLPIVWIPLSVVVLPVGIFVIMIGLCGICPSPVVLYIGSSGEKQFIVSLRKGSKFGADASTGTIKTVLEGGVALNVPAADVVSDIKIPGFVKPSKPDSAAELFDEVRGDLLRNLNKLPDPDVSELTALPTDATVSTRRSALRSSLETWLNGLSVPDLKIPKDAEKVNPKPTPVQDVVDNIKKASKLSLPEIALPSANTIDIKDKLIELVSKMRESEITVDPGITIPAVDAPDLTVEDFVKNASDWMSKVVQSALDKITPESLGIFPTVGEVTISNPYVCRQAPIGIKPPVIPGPVKAAISTVSNLAKQAVTAGLTAAVVREMISTGEITPNATFGSSTVKRMLTSTLDKSLPSTPVPDPSNLSIKDMLSQGSKILAKLQLPSMPDVSKPTKPRITISGDEIKSPVVQSVLALADSFDVAEIPNLPNPSDIKRIGMDLVESSFSKIEETLSPYINTINALQSAKDAAFGEKFGLPKISKDDSKIPVVLTTKLDAAFLILKGLSLVPYVAVALAPSAFKKLHPILSQDDLPTWDRLSLSNFLLVSFLDEWCKQGKKTCGFFENP